MAREYIEDGIIWVEEEEESPEMEKFREWEREFSRQCERILGFSPTSSGPDFASYEAFKKGMTPSNAARKYARDCRKY